MIPHYLRFYNGYTVTTVLQEYAVTFFALCNEMIKIKAIESLDRITELQIPNADNRDKIIATYVDRSEGADKLLEQARNIKNVG